MAIPFSLPSFYLLQNILSSMTLCNTLFLIRPVQLTSIFLQHNTLKLSRYLKPTLRLDTTLDISLEYSLPWNEKVFQYLSLHIIEKYLKKWKVKVNGSKSSHIRFTLRKRPLPSSQHQPNYHASNKSSKISETTLRLYVKLERTHRQIKKTNRLKNKRDQLVDRKKNPIYI